MKCANHPQQDAVGLCNECGRGVCPECQVGDSLVLCAPCLVSHNRQVMRHFFLQLAMSGGLFLAALSFVNQGTFSLWNKLEVCLMAAFFPFGWSALSRFFSPGGGYWHPMMRWVSLLGHAATAAAIGWVVGPYQIYKAIREITRAKAANASLD